jgi:cell division protein FtsI/penicillin-binding protein 2
VTGNARSVRPGPTTLLCAFAQSCNATFLSLAEELPDGALARQAAAFGFDGPPLLPIDVEGGSFPTGGGSADATAAIGQGRVVASPVLMASVAVAVESGTWRQPVLLPGGADQAVAGKTGSAESGLGADVHAWFVGSGTAWRSASSSSARSPADGPRRRSPRLPSRRAVRRADLSRSVTFPSTSHETRRLDADAV